MKGLKEYKSMPEWDADTLPIGFRQKHNTREGTWARLVVLAGNLKFTFLTEEGEEVSSQIIGAHSGPQLVEPGVWHKVTPLDDALRCQLSFLCEEERYFEKKYNLTAPHSEVRAIVDELGADGGCDILDLGSGRGRNSVYLATRGHRLVAVDHSEAAIATLREICHAESLEVSAHLYDINDANLGELLPDLEVDHVISTVVFQFLDPVRVARVIEDLQSVTKPGGVHLIVAPLDTSCPIEFPFLFKEGELLTYYRSWDIVRYAEEVGEFHKRDENGVRYRARFGVLVARKPS